MKKSKFRLFWFGIIELAVGLGLVGCSLAGVLKDSFWSGMGTSLAVMGLIFLLRGIKYRRNEDYKKEVDTEVNDERNKFLAMKAWSWAGYLFVMISAVAAIVMKILDYDQYVFFFAGSICLIMVLYWVVYMILRKKY